MGAAICFKKKKKMKGGNIKSVRHGYFLFSLTVTQRV